MYPCPLKVTPRWLVKVTTDHDGVFDLAERLCVLAVEDPEMRDDKPKENDDD